MAFDQISVKYSRPTVIIIITYYYFYHQFNLPKFLVHDSEKLYHFTNSAGKVRERFSTLFLKFEARKFLTKTLILINAMIFKSNICLKFWPEINKRKGRAKRDCANKVDEIERSSMIWADTSLAWPGLSGQHLIRWWSIVN